MTMLRNMLGQETLADILMKREAIAERLKRLLEPPTDEWGVKIERVEM